MKSIELIKFKDFEIYAQLFGVGVCVCVCVWVHACVSA